VVITRTGPTDYFSFRLRATLAKQSLEQRESFLPWLVVHMTDGVVGCILIVILKLSRVLVRNG
jgi:hypothetical protein